MSRIILVCYDIFRCVAKDKHSCTISVEITMAVHFTYYFLFLIEIFGMKNENLFKMALHKYKTFFGCKINYDITVLGVLTDHLFPLGSSDPSTTPDPVISPLISPDTVVLLYFVMCRN